MYLQKKLQKQQRKYKTDERGLRTPSLVNEQGRRKGRVEKTRET